MVSVIIPVYNAERYIATCIESIISQTYANFEVLMIDDGSKDRSAGIMEEYAKMDERFKLYRQENSGPSAARNKGLELARGEYIAFVDADDYIDVNMLRKMVGAVSEYRADLVECGIQIQWEKSAEQVSVADKPQAYSSDFMKSIYEEFMFITKATTAGLWNKLYKTALIKRYELAFDENLRDDEDWLFNCEYLCYVNKYIKIPDCLYYYNRNNENSITYSMHQDYFEGLLWKDYLARDFAKKWDMYCVDSVIKMDRFFINRMKWFAMYKFWHDAYKKEPLKEKIQMMKQLLMRNDLRNYIKKTIQTEHLTKRQRFILHNINQKHVNTLVWYLLLEWKFRELLHH